jgi:hypothetical protein
MQLEMEREALKKEKDAASRERLEKLERELAEVKEQASTLRAQWLKEKEEIGKTQKVAERVEQLRAELEQAQRRGDLHRASEIQYGLLPDMERELKKMEHATPSGDSEKKATAILREEVTEEDIAKVVATWTGIPVSRLQEGERAKLVKMEERLMERVVGQQQAIKAVSNAVRRHRAHRVLAPVQVNRMAETGLSGGVQQVVLVERHEHHEQAFSRSESWSEVSSSATSSASHGYEEDCDCGPRQAAGRDPSGFLTWPGKAPGRP